MRRFLLGLNVLGFLVACGAEIPVNPPSSTEESVRERSTEAVTHAELHPEISNESPYRIGGDVKAPVVTKRVEPEYVPLQPGEEAPGVVIIELAVTKEGRARDVKILSDPNENATRVARAVE